MIHEISVGSYSLEPASMEVGTRGSYGVEQMNLTFSSEWDGLAKTVTFFPPRRKAVSVVITSDDAFDIPWEATEQSGKIPFIVFGFREGKRVYSVTGALAVTATKNRRDAFLEEPTPSEAEQMLSHLADITERIDAGLLKGEKGADGYTPIKGVDYFDGKDGEDGKSITVQSVMESTEDGGSNYVTFSDGTTVVVKNGNKGDKGDAGGSNALIVTGNFPTSETVVNGVAYAIIESADSGMNLSHTVAEMVEAFQAGRDVKIRLTSAGYGSAKFGGWDFRHAELSVFEAEDIMDSGMYAFYAYGTGYTYYKQEAAPLFIECSLNPNPRIYVHIKTETATYAGEVEVN